MIKLITKKLDGLHLKDFIKEKDALFADRREHKFIVAQEKLNDILSFLKDNFLYLYFDEGLIYEYHNTYFDTADFRFFREHRQGKYNRSKIRVREYQNGVQSTFVEHKRKVKGVKTKKKRRQIDNDTIDLRHDFIEESLSEQGLNLNELQEQTEVFYKRINLVSKDYAQRITLDFDIYSQKPALPKKPLIPEYFVLEIKAQKIPHDIIRFLRSHKIQETRFSKYCLSVCHLNPEIKRNKWKMIFKKYF